MKVTVIRWNGYRMHRNAFSQLNANHLCFQPESPLTQLTCINHQSAGSDRELLAAYEAHVELELLPEPIYRYESEGVDGGIFAFVENDDPQAILWIEAVEDPVLPTSWRYAVVQCTSGVLHVQYRAQKAVTIAAAANYTGTSTDPFWLVWVGTDQPRHEVRPSPPMENGSH